MAPMFRARRYVAVFCGLALRVGVARADSAIDAIEHVFGATNINAVTGHGRLAEGVSVDGDVTVLTWPNPSFADQLAYLSSNDFHARSLPRLGAPEGAGIFLGLLLVDKNGDREVTWLRDRTRWQIDQSYGDADGPNIVTRHVSAALGLTVTVTDAIQSPADAEDILVRLVDVDRTADSQVAAAWLLAYANLSPTPPNSRIPELPVVDWIFDGSNDFAALWDATVSAVIHFHPRDQLIYSRLNDLLLGPAVAYGPIGDQLKAGAPDAETLAGLASDLDADYAPGAYIALTTVPAPDEHQLGYDATPMCAMRDTLVNNIFALPSIFPSLQLPIDPGTLTVFRCSNRPPPRVREGWTYDAADAFEDAQDGDLQGSGIAAGEVNEALRTPLTFIDTGGGATARAGLVLSFAPTAAQARAAIAAVTDPEQVVQAATQALLSWETAVQLPTAAPPVTRAVARRALINLRVATDAATGAAVASISRQPPYYLDWPRDGTFFNVALDVSGQSAVASQRADLFVAWQRHEPVRPTPLVDQPPPPDPTTGETHTYPADSWEMNYYPDGMAGGPIRFEIDNTALALWSIIAQIGWVPAAATTSFLADRWAPIAQTANLLARWRDPVTGLQAAASEDDNTAYTQTLHGAVTVYGALDVAARAAHLIGHEYAAHRWELRACELRNAITTTLYDSAAHRFISAAGDVFDPAHVPTGETAWLVWPDHLLAWDDPRIDDQLVADLQTITPAVQLETEGGSYFMKTTVTLGLVKGRDTVLGPLVAAARDQIATAHATPITHHFGESFLVVQGPDGPQVSQRVATPHVWEGILFYLTAMGIEHPEAFDRYDSVLPPSQVPPPGSACTVPATCTGDCDASGRVTIDELLTGVGIALGEMVVADCPSLDSNNDQTVSVDEVLHAVNSALTACPATTFQPSSPQ